MKKLALLPMAALALALSVIGAPLTNPPPQLTVGWDASLTPSNQLRNYFVYYGPLPGTYTNKVNAGLALTVTLSNLDWGGTYYLAATAVGTNGLQSTNYSNEISTNFPAPPLAPSNLRIVPVP